MMVMLMVKIPGRTEAEKYFDISILVDLSLVWALYHPADKGTWQDNRWMETLYYRRKWQLLCRYS